jgi:hypothetical protein
LLQKPLLHVLLGFTHVLLAFTHKTTKRIRVEHCASQHRQPTPLPQPVALRHEALEQLLLMLAQIHGNIAGGAAVYVACCYCCGCYQVVVLGLGLMTVGNFDALQAQCQHRKNNLINGM